MDLYFFLAGEVIDVGAIDGAEGVAFRPMADVDDGIEG